MRGAVARVRAVSSERRGDLRCVQWHSHERVRCLCCRLPSRGPVAVCGVHTAMACSRALLLSPLSRRACLRFCVLDHACFVGSSGVRSGGCAHRRRVCREGAGVRVHGLGRRGDNSTPRGGTSDTGRREHTTQAATSHSHKAHCRMRPQSDPARSRATVRTRRTSALARIVEKR